MREINKESVRTLARIILPDWQYEYVIQALKWFSLEEIKTSVNYDAIRTKPLVELLESGKLSAGLVTLLKDICDKDPYCSIDTIITGKNGECYIELYHDLDVTYSKEYICTDTLQRWNTDDFIMYLINH
jgi:hypothetical protein